MKKPIKIILFILWILVGSVLATRFWLTHPELFPDFPKPAAYFLIDLFGAQGPEEIADLEILTGMVVSMPTLCILTLACLKLFKMLRNG